MKGDQKPDDEEFERHLRSLGVTNARPERVRWKWQQRRDKKRAMKFIHALTRMGDK